MKSAEISPKTRWRLNMIAKGLCGYCAARPPRLGSSRCEVCLATERERARTPMRELYRARRRLGRCIRCEKKVRDGGSLCKPHRTEINAYQRARQAALV